MTSDPDSDIHTFFRRYSTKKRQVALFDALRLISLFRQPVMHGGQPPGLWQRFALRIGDRHHGCGGKGIENRLLFR